VLLDRITSAEFDRTERAIKVLSTVSWAEPLLQRLERAGGIRHENMPLMFELRYAQEILLAGSSATYEHVTGIGDSSVDFRTDTEPGWLIELVSVRTSNATRRATRKRGPISETLLVPTPDDPDRSEAGEIIRAQGKIGEKVLARKAPTKFPPAVDSFHMILIDMRGFLLHGGDFGDYGEIAYGAQAFQPHQFPLLHWVSGRPVKGLFELNNARAAARLIQERIHVLSFVCERHFYECEIGKIAYNAPNYNLFHSTEAASEALRSHPCAKKVAAT
jgi:hypothetical protein